MLKRSSSMKKILHAALCCGTPPGLLMHHSLRLLAQDHTIARLDFIVVPPKLA